GASPRSACVCPDLPPGYSKRSSCTHTRRPSGRIVPRRAPASRPVISPGVTGSHRCLWLLSCSVLLDRGFGSSPLLLRGRRRERRWYINAHARSHGGGEGQAAHVGSLGSRWLGAVH